MCVADGESGDGNGFVKKCCPEGEVIWPSMDTCVRVSDIVVTTLVGPAHGMVSELLQYKSKGYRISKIIARATSIMVHLISQRIFG